MAGQASKSSIERALSSPEAEVRRQATSRLADVELETALPLLLKSLGDDDWRVRKEATVAAHSFEPSIELVNALVTLLHPGDNVGLRNAAVDVLAGVGPIATAALFEAFDTLDSDGRKLAVEALGRSHDPGAVTALEAALDDADDNVRQGAIEGISRLGLVARDRVQEILLRSLDDRDRLVRLTAVEGLSSLDVGIPWERVERFLEDPMLRPVALSAAALASSPAAARALVKGLAHARGATFAQALAALARLADGPLVRHVAQCLRAEGEGLGQRLVAVAADVSGREAVELRAMALRLSAMTGAPAAVDCAVAALSDEMLAEPAQRALLTLGSAAIPGMIARLADHETHALARAALVDVLAELATEAGQPGGAPIPTAALYAAVRAAARDPDRAVAARALSSLAVLGGAEDLELASRETLAESRAVAVAASGALAAIAARHAAQARAHVNALMQRDDALLPAAILLGALALTGASSPLDAAFLAHVATTGNTLARRAAVLAVSEIEGPAAMEVLSFALADEEREVQLAAARALGRMVAVSTSNRASEILDFVQRTGGADLVAVAVRAVGEGMSLTYAERRSVPPPPPAPELLAALALFARGAPSPVAIAAVDALGHALTAGGGAAADALAAAFEHPDSAVVKAAIFKLAENALGRKRLVRAVDGASVIVCVLAAETLVDVDTPELRERLLRRAAAETNREVGTAIERALARSFDGPRSEGSPGSRPKAAPLSRRRGTP